MRTRNERSVKPLVVMVEMGSARLGMSNPRVLRLEPHSLVLGHSFLEDSDT